MAHLLNVSERFPLCLTQMELGQNSCHLQMIPLVSHSAEKRKSQKAGQGPLEKQPCGDGVVLI